jgi:hypothetical protein
VSLRSLSAQDQSRFRSKFRSRHQDALGLAVQSPSDSSALLDALWITESLRSRSMLGELAARADDVLADTALARAGSDRGVRTSLGRKSAE